MSSNNNIPLLVIGAGSIGERHIGILQKLGYTNIHVYRQRNLPLRTILPGTVNIFTDWSQLQTIKPVAAIICTPTSQHLKQAVECAALGIHLLIEKPLAATPGGLEELKKQVLQRNVYVQVAYMLRYHPLVKHLQLLISEARLGKLLNFQTYWGEYLPDWHPWEDYRHSYAARKELGGGAALTLSHDIDLVLWLCNSRLEDFSVIKNFRSSLEVNVEAGADIIFRFANGITGHSHVNFYEKMPNRTYRFVFEEAVAVIRYFENLMEISGSDKSYTVNAEGFERNQLFEDQCRYFMSKIKNFTTQESLEQVETAEQIIKICT